MLKRIMIIFLNKLKATLGGKFECLLSLSTSWLRFIHTARRGAPLPQARSDDNFNARSNTLVTGHHYFMMMH